MWQTISKATPTDPTKHTIKAKSTHNRTNPWQLDKEMWTQGVWLHNINMNGIGGPSINI